MGSTDGRIGAERTGGATPAGLVLRASDSPATGRAPTGVRSAVIALPFGTAALLAMLITTAHADPDCTCRGPDGRRYGQGETVCLQSPAGPRVARCEMALNNSSWTFTDAACPRPGPISQRLSPHGRRFAETAGRTLR